MEKLRPYFALKGRAPRLEYWKTILFALLALAGVWLVALFATMILGPLGGVLMLLLLVPLAAMFCAAVRRLHDRNKSGWWLLLFWLLPSLLSAMSEAAIKDPELAGAGGLYALISLIFSIWAFVEIGCLRGTKGLNKYGSDPCAPAVAEVFA